MTMIPIADGNNGYFKNKNLSYELLVLEYSNKNVKFEESL